MKTTYEDLYTSLGFLFYSIAANDGRVSPGQKEKLKTLIREQWLPMESSRDDLGTDSGHYIDISFDYANDQRMDTDDAFSRFMDEFKADPGRFDASMRRMILETATAIVDASGRKNALELARLNELERHFRS